MRVVYTADLHGELEFYRAAGSSAVARQADALILGGDLCPGTPSASAVHLPGSQPEFLRNQLAPLLRACRRAHSALRVFAIPGNDDCQTILPVLDELSSQGLIENLHQRVATLGNFSLVGLAFVPPTPFSIKDFERHDLPGDTLRQPQLARCVLGTARGFKPIEDFESYLQTLPTLQDELERLPPTDPGRTVAVIHGPPYQTRCDVLFDGRHIGSQAVRRWIEQRQPLLTLHGHIHESPKSSGAFWDRIGATTVVNPGSEHTRPHLVFIDLQNPRELEHSIYGRQQIV
jgi:Icc-related predicted phosphoesterase